MIQESESAPDNQKYHFCSSNFLDGKLETRNFSPPGILPEPGILLRITSFWMII